MDVVGAVLPRRHAISIHAGSPVAVWLRSSKRMHCVGPPARPASTAANGTRDRNASYTRANAMGACFKTGLGRCSEGSRSLFAPIDCCYPGHLESWQRGSGQDGKGERGKGKGERDRDRGACARLGQGVVFEHATARTRVEGVELRPITARLRSSLTPTVRPLRRRADSQSTATRFTVRLV